jgi:hypothetical protein
MLLEIPLLLLVKDSPSDLLPWSVLPFMELSLLDLPTLIMLTQLLKSMSLILMFSLDY